MKITRAANTFVLHLGKREKLLFSELLDLYPRVPSAHHRSRKSKNTPTNESTQKLLDEALAEQRAENKKQLQKLLQDPERAKDSELGLRLTLYASYMDWRLQILNDIRVGCWVLLGSPEPKEELALLDETTAPHFWSM